MPYTANGDVLIHYRVEGSGPPLILHHGLSDSLGIWDELGLVERLGRHLTLIMLDARGHGASAKLYEPHRYGLAELAGDVIAVLDALGIAQAHYYGYSLGGWVGFGLAAQAPARLRSLVLGGAHPFAEQMGPFRELIGAGLDRWVAALEAQVGRSMPGLASRARAGDSSALQALLTLDRPDHGDSLAAINMPCTLFAGTADPRLPLVERAARQLPHATFVPLPGANHIQAYLEARAILEIVERHVAAAEQQVPLPAARLEHVS